jgi:hypothetical protein
MGRPTRHQTDWVAFCLRRAAADAGVELPISYSQANAADDLAREPELAVSRLGAGVVLHARPNSDNRLPIVLGYADIRDQWYRDGHRHIEPAAAQTEQVSSEVAL